MRKKLLGSIAVLLSVVLLGACGKLDPQLTEFHNNMDEFCTKVSTIDSAINAIDAESDDAVDELLAKLDELDGIFQNFSSIDFPEEFDYLEPIAKESGDYMATAVQSYHDAYSNGSYNEYTAEYAHENYVRANKRLQIIIAFLHGETPEDVNVE